jgi:hypothetical protein
MSSQPYKGFFISVEGIPYAAGTFLRCPLIKISAEEEGATVVMLFSTDEFRLEKDAEDYGFQIGERWIDAHLETARKLRVRH